MNTPIFLEFIPLGLNHKPTIDQALLRIKDNHSAANFTNLFILDTENDTMIAETPLGLLIKQTELYSDREYFVLIPNRTDLDINSLLTLSIPELSLYPYPVTGAIEDIDNTDYLYSIDDWIKLGGQQFASIRRKVNHFHTNNQYSFRKITATDHQSLWDFMDTLLINNLKTNPEQSQSLKTETLALEKLLLFEQKLGVTLHGLFVDNILHGFAVTDHIPKNTVLIHLFRTNNEISGIGETLFHEIAKFNNEHETINFEQDLGIPGLRKFKEYLNPIAKLPAYTIPLNR